MSENENNIPEAALEEEDAFEVKKVRLAKLAAMREAGKDPYTVTKFARDCTAAAIKDEFDRLENTEVRIAGRIMSRRDMGKANSSISPTAADASRYTCASTISARRRSRSTRSGI